MFSHVTVESSGVCVYKALLFLLFFPAKGSFKPSAKEFCTYLWGGDTRRDKEYFLRCPSAFAESRLCGDIIHELETDLLSPKDHLVTIIKAYDRYGKFIETKLLNHLEA